MLRVRMATLAAALVSLPATAQVQPFPAGFHTRDVATNGAKIHVRVGGAGPAVVLLHGYGETGDMWAPLAADLARDHVVVVPDLRGIGLSSHPPGGYDKKTQAGDVAGVLDALKIERADLVTHDIGNMVGYAFAAQYPTRVTRFVLMDAPLPGVGPWDPMPSGWSRAASASTSTVSGTSSQPIRRASAKRRVTTMPSSMPGRAPCTVASRSSPRSIRMRSTTRDSLPRVN